MKRILMTFVKILVFFIGWAVLAGIINVPSTNPAIWRFFAELIPLVVLVIFTAVFLLIEKKKVHIPVKQNCFKGIMSGSAVGFIWIGAAGGILFLLNQFEIIDKSEVPLFGLWIISAFINVVTMCLFTTALYEAEGTLLAPIMAHAVWNIVGALFLGGVSLADDYPHLLTLSASVNTLLSGGNYKIEASIVTTVINISLSSCSGRTLFSD